MAITVTATGGGVTAPSLLMKVSVLTSAAAVAGQTGATKAVTDTSLTPFFDQSITTTVTGSQVFGVMGNGTGGAFTADARTTIDSQLADSSGSQIAAWHATSQTGSPGATTLGASAPTGNAGGWVAAEILASGTMAIDGSSPAAVNGNSAATTASFTPPSGSLLVAAVIQDGTNPTLTMSNSGAALNWTVLVSSNAADGFHSSVVVADIPATSAMPAVREHRKRHTGRRHGAQRSQVQMAFGVPQAAAPAMVPGLLASPTPAVQRAETW